MRDETKHDALEIEALDLDPKELKRMFVILKKSHEEELLALRDQLMQLKNDLKASQGEFANGEQGVLPNEEFDKMKKRNDQLERVILHLRERTEEAKLETKTLRDELEVIYQKQGTVQPSSENDSLQSHYDQLIDENKQLAAKLEEALRSVNSQATKWEEKYSRLYDQFQEGELRYRDLKKVEEKFVQVQLMLANINSLIGIHAPFPPDDPRNGSSR
jgi:hypothetical protein